MKFAKSKEGGRRGRRGEEIFGISKQKLCAKGAKCEARPVVERNWKLTSVYRESLGLFRGTTTSPCSILGRSIPFFLLRKTRIVYAEL